MKSSLPVLALSLVVSAVSVGCGGSSESEPITPPVIEPVAVALSSQFPANIIVDFDENSDSSIVGASFTFETSSTAAFSVSELSAGDGERFSIDISETTGSSTPAGERSFNINLEPIAEFDFEQPEDANADNTYEFSFSTALNTEMVTTSVVVNISDVIELPEIPANIVFGSLTEQRIGQGLSFVRDLTNDGMAEIVFTSEVCTNTNAGGVILDGTTFEAAKGSVTFIDDIDPLIKFTESACQDVAGQSSRRLTAGLTPSGDSAEIYIHQESDRRITRAEISPGNFADIALSENSENTLVIGGDDFSSASSVGDLNEDGINEVLINNLTDFGNSVVLVDGSPFVPESTEVQFSGGVEFRSSSVNDVTAASLITYPDLNEDGGPEYLLTLSGFDSATNARISELWVLDGALINMNLSGTELALLRLDDLNSEQGTRIPNLNTPELLGDDDGDGFVNLRIPYKIETETSFIFIDGDELAQLPMDASLDDIFNNGGRQLTFPAIEVIPFVSGLIEFPDVNGDDVVDFAFPVLDSSATQVEIAIFSGADFAAALAGSADNSIEFNDLPLIELDLSSVFINSRGGLNRYITLADQTVDRVYFSSRFTDNTMGVLDAGTVASISTADIRAAISQDIARISAVPPLE